MTFTGIDGINIFKATSFSDVICWWYGAVVFSALAMNAVGKAAMEMVNEVVVSLKKFQGLWKEGKPDYAKCVDISTKASLKEMMLPGILTIGFPIAVVFVGKVFTWNNLMVAEMLGGYMAGVTVSGVFGQFSKTMLVVHGTTLKKSFEAGVEINGEMTYKGSEAHKAAVTGDTVGDPFKDTSGPSMNILIKLTCLIGLVIAPILGGGHAAADKNHEANVFITKDGTKINITSNTKFVSEHAATKIVKMNIDKNDDGTAKATVTTTTTENGKEVTKDEIFEGTLEEVEKKLNAFESKNWRNSC